MTTLIAQESIFINHFMIKEAVLFVVTMRQIVAGFICSVVLSSVSHHLFICCKFAITKVTIDLLCLDFYSFLYQLRVVFGYIQGFFRFSCVLVWKGQPSHLQSPSFVWSMLLCALRSSFDVNSCLQKSHKNYLVIFLCDWQCGPTLVKPVCFRMSRTRSSLDLLFSSS